MSALGSRIGTVGVMVANLECWSCGALREIEISQPPRFAFEVAGWANDVGWVGVIDHRYSRSLVFCSNSCLENETAKTGAIRARPKNESKRRKETRSRKAATGG